MDTQFAASSGSLIYARRTGVGPPVLAIHGLGGGAYFFSGLGPRLTDRVTLFAIDLPGTGRSTAGRGGISMDAWVQDLGEFVAREVGRPAVLVGHSLGTIIALEAWRAWPERIAGLVFAGGLPKARPEFHERLSARAVAVRGQGSLDGWGPKISPGVFSPTTIADRCELVGLWERLLEAQDVEAYVRCIDVLLGASAESIVPSVTAASLSISGVDDQYAPPELVRAFMAQIPHGRTKVLDACGHLPFLEQPEVFAALLGDFAAAQAP